MNQRRVKALQHDTLDAICYRYFGVNTAQYLPQVLALNRDLVMDELAHGQPVYLPEQVKTSQKQPLNLWD